MIGLANHLPWEDQGSRINDRCFLVTSVLVIVEANESEKARVSRVGEGMETEEMRQ